jgi:hypothetical protein
MMNKKSNILKLFGIIALVAVINLGLAGCKTDADDGGGGGGNIPTELVGNWYIQATDAFAFEITSAGKLDNHMGITMDVSVSGNTVTLSSYGYSGGTFDYSISNGKMTITNGTGGAAGYGQLSPLVKK